MQSDPTSFTIDHPAIAAEIAKADAQQTAIRTAATEMREAEARTRDGAVRAAQSNKTIDALIDGRRPPTTNLGDLLR